VASWEAQLLTAVTACVRNVKGVEVQLENVKVEAWAKRQDTRALQISSYSRLPQLSSRLVGVGRNPHYGSTIKNCHSSTITMGIFWNWMPSSVACVHPMHDWQQTDRSSPPRTLLWRLASTGFVVALTGHCKAANSLCTPSLSMTRLVHLRSEPSAAKILLKHYERRQTHLEGRLRAVPTA
jgi:hypothetical protein